MMGVFVQVNTDSRKALAVPTGYVIQESGCWDWVAPACGTGGYGMFRHPLTKKVVRAHRYIYEQEVGPIPEGLTLDHLCRNRACVNPAHLEPVSNKVNALRGVGVGAKNLTKTHCPQGHLLAGENLEPYEKRFGWRRCATCHAAGKVRSKRKKNERLNAD